MGTSRFSEKRITRSQHSLTLAAANTEYSLFSPGLTPALFNTSNVVGIRFGIRGGSGQLRYAYQPGKVASQVEPFALRPGGYYEAIDGGVPPALYFATDTAGAVLELEIERAQ